MPTFAYSARPASGGDIQSGEIELASKDDVLAYLHRQKMIPVSVREKAKEFTGNISSVFFLAREYPVRQYREFAEGSQETRRVSSPSAAIARRFRSCEKKEAMVCPVQRR